MYCSYRKIFPSLWVQILTRVGSMFLSKFLIQKHSIIQIFLIKHLFRNQMHSNALSFYRQNRSQNVLCRSKFFIQSENLTAFSASSNTFVPAQKNILLNPNHTFVRRKIYVTATKEGLDQPKTFWDL